MSLSQMLLPDDDSFQMPCCDQLMVWSSSVTASEAWVLPVTLVSISGVSA